MSVGIVVTSILIIIVFAFICMREYMNPKEQMIDDRLLSRVDRSVSAVQNEIYPQGNQSMCIGSTCLTEDDMKQMISQRQNKQDTGEVNFRLNCGSTNGQTGVEYVTFATPYTVIPKVTCALKLVDWCNINGTNLRINSWVTDVTTIGFNLHCATWADTSMYAGTVMWLSFVP